jgi:hypothetical protein
VRLASRSATQYWRSSSGASSSTREQLTEFDHSEGEHHKVHNELWLLPKVDQLAPSLPENQSSMETFSVVLVSVSVFFTYKMRLEVPPHMYWF